MASWCQWLSGLPPKHQQQLAKRKVGLHDGGRLISIGCVENDASHGYMFDNDKKLLWLDGKNRMCFRLFADGLQITWGSSEEYWTHPKVPFCNETIAVAELKEVCWFEVGGTVDEDIVQMLTPNTKYQVSVELQMKKRAYGWDDPVQYFLETPFTAPQLGRKNFGTEIPKDGNWTPLPLGEFTVPPCIKENGNIRFQLLQTVENWKTGLVIRSLIIRAIN